MLIKLHGILKKDFGPEIFIEADTVAEAIEGFTRQVDFYSNMLLDERPILRVIGFDTLETLFGKTEQDEIHIVPAMIGGGGGFGKILIGAALVGLALTGVGAGIAIAGTSLATMAFTVGVGLILSGTMQLFMKAPSISKENDPDASKYLGIGDNTVNIGTPIALQWGRGPATGHVLAINVDSTEMITGTFPTNPT